MSLNCIIVDDEPRAHVILKAYIDELNNLAFAGSFRNALTAFTHLKTHQTDLIFLDINMPKMDGFSLVDMLNPKPMVIFTTAHIDHALKSYEYNAIDYLHKPIRFERFVSAVEKAEKWRKLSENHGGSGFIEVRTKKQKQKIDTRDILYIECVGNYARLFCKDESVTQTLITAKELEEILPRHFLRIHRSFIVNTGCITSSDENNITINGASLPIGTTYRKYVQQNLRR